MKINELLVESQQLDEGPFTQAVGKVGGKIAKGVANVGKDLKTGFKAGYSGEQPPAAAPRDPDVPMNPKTGKPLTEPERQAHQDAGGKFDGVTGDPLPLDTKAAPAKSGGLKGALNSFKQGFTKGYKGATAPAADTTTAAPADQTAPAADTAPTSQAAPAATTPSATAPAGDAAPAPAANPKADAQSKVGVGQINKIIPTLRTRDLMSLKKNLDAVIAKKSAEKPAAAAPAADTTTAAPASQTAPAAATPPEAVAKQGRKKKAAPDQATIDADRERLMGRMNDSIERHKQNMVAEGLVNGSIKIFKR